MKNERVLVQKGRAAQSVSRRLSFPVRHAVKKLGVMVDLECLPVRDGAAAVCSLLANGAVVCFGWTASRAAFPRDSAAQIALSAAVIGIGTVIGLATILGACGLLKPLALQVLASAVSAAAVWLIMRSDRTQEPAGLSEAVNGFRGWRGFDSEAMDQRAWLLWAVPLAASVAHIAVSGLARFPEEFDGLAYHIPLIDHWFQAQSLYAVDAAWWWTPANAELLGYWIVAPFSGDFLIALGNLPFLVLWVLAAVEFARLLGLSVIWRHLGVLAMLAVHTTFHEAEKAMSDLAVAAFFFAAVAFGFRYISSRQRCDLRLAGIAIGLLAGVKYFALGYAVLAGFVIAAGTALSLGRRHFGHALVALILTAVPFGGYWYMRNYWLTRVPLYPQGADAIGIGYPNLWETTLVGNPDSQRIALAARALWIMTGPYHVFAVAAVPIAAVSLAWRGICRFRRGARAEAAVSLGFSVLLIGSAAIFAITPFCVEDQPGTLNHLRWAYTPARYGLCFLSVVAIATAWLAKQGVDQLTLWLARWLGAPSVMHPAVPLAFQGLFAAGVAWQLYLRLSYLSAHPDLRYAPDLLGEALLALSLCGTGWLTLEWARGTSWSRGKVTAIAAAAVFGGASAGAAGLSIHWHNEYGRHFDALRGTTVFSFLSRGPGKTIAVLDLRPYPFFGSARQHRVCSPRILTAYDELVAYLETRHPDFVASPPRKTGDFFNRYEPGPEWLRMHESVFKPIVRGGAFNLYSFNRPRRGKAALGHTQSNFGDGSHYK